jgi:hypothetical protein
MKRSNFLKSLATLIAAPTLIEKIDLKKGFPIVKSESYTANFGMMIPKSSIKTMSELNSLTPKYYNDFVVKYDSKNFEWIINESK